MIGFPQLYTGRFFDHFGTTLLCDIIHHYTPGKAFHDIIMIPQEILERCLVSPATAIACTASLFFLSLWTYRLTLHPLAGFPGPRLAACSSFYFLYYIWNGFFPQHCDRLFRYYDSDVVRVAPSQLVFRDAESLKHISERPETYRGNFAFRVIGFTKQTLSNVVDPAEHKRKRRILAPGFSATALADQEPYLVVPLVDKLVSKISEIEGNPLDLSMYLDCVTTDIVGVLSYGANFGMLDELENHPFLHAIPNVLRLSAILMCIPEMYQILSWAYSVGPKWIIPKYLRAVADFASYHLLERRKRDAQEVGGRKDIIGVIEAQNEKMKGTKYHFNYTQYELEGEATNIVAGGGDTVATALTAAMFHLGQNPEIYNKLVTEIRGTFDSSKDINSQAAARSIPYLDAVINESLRISPVLPGPTWRRTDTPINVVGYHIPGGTELGTVRFCLLLNEKYFHDPYTFKPQRWLEDMGDHREAFMPFGIGPRTCIGRNIAWMELRLIICKLLWHFDWTPITATFNNPDFIVQYRKPMWMRAQKRINVTIGTSD